MFAMGKLHPLSSLGLSTEEESPFAVKLMPPEEEDYDEEVDEDADEEEDEFDEDYEGDDDFSEEYDEYEEVDGEES